MKYVLHLRRALTHRRQVRADGVRRRVMCGLRRVINFSCVTLLVGPTHILRTSHFLGTTLLIVASLLLQAPLLIKSTSLRRVSTVSFAFTRRCRRPTVTHVFQARSVFI